MPSTWITEEQDKVKKPRVYVDPWDLENYAFMRRHLHNMQEEAQDYQYQCVPARTIPSADSPTLFAGIDELDFHNDNFCEGMENQDTAADNTRLRKTSSRPLFAESGSSLSSGCEQSSLMVYEGEQYIYAPATRVRKMTTSKAPQLQPIRRFRNVDCPECQYLESEYVSMSQYELEMQSLSSSGYVRPPPDHFGLSPYGHLKIDYSCSWHSLDRIISNEC